MKSKERIFERTKFNNSRNAGFVARDVVKNMSRGSASAEKITTVLNIIHESEHISSIFRINNDVIKNYESYLISAVSDKSLKPHTAQGYASSVNAISNYINLRTDKNLPIISPFKAGIKNKLEYGGKETPQALYNKVYSQVKENQQIKLELQRYFGLRVQESHCIKKSSIKNALSTGILHLEGKLDRTKNTRSRDITIRTEKQKEVLTRTLDYMEKTKQNSLIETNLKYRQAQSKYYRDLAKAGGTRKNNNGHNFSHGNRHFSLQETFKLTGSDKIVSGEAGHGEERTTDIYLGKH